VRILQILGRLLHQSRLEAYSRHNESEAPELAAGSRILSPGS
jgi:hypothetical protein